MRTVMGVHSGKEGISDQAGRVGVNYATNGCIRTTDDAMAEIEQTAKNDELETIEVKNNKAPVPVTSPQGSITVSEVGGNGHLGHASAVYVNGAPVN